MSPARKAPAAGARDQVARLLTLVPFLHRRDGVRLAEAAALLGVTPEQVLRDLKVLFLCGLPGGLPDDLIDVDLDAIETDDGGAVHDGVVRIGNADYLDRPLRLTATEASALMVALKAMREGSGEDTVAVVDRVVLKLEDALGAAAVPVAVAPSPGDASRAASARLAPLLEEAAREQRLLRLSYFTPSRQEEAERVVEPYGVVTAGAFTYLDAWCRNADGDRLFRLDRIRGVERLDGTRRGPRRPARDLAAEGLFGDPDDAGTALVTLALDPEARWITEYYPVREVRPTPDGGAEVDLVVVDRAWLHRLLLRLAPHARVLRPREFTDSFTATAQRTLSLYEDGGVG